MVDIGDMQDIFYEIIIKEHPHEIASFLSNKLIREVKDFVEAQKHIACVNCKGYKFKNLKTRAQAG